MWGKKDQTYKYQCGFCGDESNSLWRCRDCGDMVCDACSKGGKSSKLGVAGRVVAGYVSVGATEALRSGYRKVNQHCPSCESKDLIRI